MRVNVRRWLNTGILAILGFLNYFLLQWFFVRLAVVTDDAGNLLRWLWLRYPLPLSGWHGWPYRWFGGRAQAPYISRRRR